MTIWIVVHSAAAPPAWENTLRAAYAGKGVIGRDNPGDPERMVMVEGRDGKFMSGSSRITPTQAGLVAAGHMPWVEMFTEFPPPDKWQAKLPI